MFLEITYRGRGIQVLVILYMFLDGEMEVFYWGEVCLWVEGGDFVSMLFCGFC